MFTTGTVVQVHKTDGSVWYIESASVLGQDINAAQLFTGTVSSSFLIPTAIQNPGATFVNLPAMRKN